MKPMQIALKQMSDEKGKQIIDKLVAYTDDFDAASNDDDKKRKVEIVNKCIPLIKEMAKHLNTRKYDDMFDMMIKEFETKIQEGNVDLSDMIKFAIKHTTKFVGLQFPPPHNDD